MGLLLHAIVHSAGIQDRDGGIWLLATLFGQFPFLAKLFADSAYAGSIFHTAYNLSVMVFGGSAQFFVTWLIQAIGSPIAPVFYLMFGMTLGLVASLFLVERAHARLPALVTIPPSIGAA